MILFIFWSSPHDKGHNLVIGCSSGPEGPNVDFGKPCANVFSVIMENNRGRKIALVAAGAMAGISNFHSANCLHFTSYYLCYCLSHFSKFFFKKLSLNCFHLFAADEDL